MYKFKIKAKTPFNEVYTYIHEYEYIQSHRYFQLHINQRTIALLQSYRVCKGEEVRKVVFSEGFCSFSCCIDSH